MSAQVVHDVTSVAMDLSNPFPHEAHARMCVCVQVCDCEPLWETACASVSLLVGCFMFLTFGTNRCVPSIVVWESLWKSSTPIRPYIHKSERPVPIRIHGHMHVHISEHLHIRLRVRALESPHTRTSTRTHAWEEAVGTVPTA